MTVIRLSHSHLHAPNSDTCGTYRHLAIDQFGVAVRVELSVVWVWGKVVRG